MEFKQTSSVIGYIVVKSKFVARRWTSSTVLISLTSDGCQTCQVEIGQVIGRAFSLLIRCHQNTKTGEVIQASCMLERWLRRHGMTMKITGHQDAKVLVLVAVSNCMAIDRVKRGRGQKGIPWYREGNTLLIQTSKVFGSVNQECFHLMHTKHNEYHYLGWGR